MRLGITQLLPTSAAEITPTAIRRVRDFGFAGTALSINDDPATIPSEQLTNLATRFTDADVAVVEYGQYQTNFVTPDDTELQAHLNTVNHACRVAAAVGCPVVIVGIGSHNPRGNWFAHPDNYSPHTEERLIANLRQAASIAEVAGVVLALECHVTTTLRNAVAARRVLDAVGASNLKVHLDVVNWMTFETMFDNARAIDDMYQTLGPSRISGAHSKGATVEDSLIVHMNETFTGAPDDLIDHSAVLKGLAELGGDPWLVIEHLQPDEMPHARAHLVECARKLNLTLTAPEPSA